MCMVEHSLYKLTGFHALSSESQSWFSPRERTAATPRYQQKVLRVVADPQRPWCNAKRTLLLVSTTWIVLEGKQLDLGGCKFPYVASLHSHHQSHLPLSKSLSLSPSFTSLRGSRLELPLVLWFSVARSTSCLLLSLKTTYLKKFLTTFQV